MKKFVTGGGKRRGQNDMPAITLPYEIHRNLLTTGGVQGYKAFHQSLVDLCDKGQIDDALIRCYREYQSKGLNLKTHKSEIMQSLRDHVNLGLILNAQENKIIRTIF